jgi:hypothetical protein
VVCPEGFIWGIPSNADCLLKIDPRTDTASTVGNLPNTRDKWQGGFVANDELGRPSIWCIPESAEAVLKVVTATGEVRLLGHTADVR